MFSLVNIIFQFSIIINTICLPNGIAILPFKKRVPNLADIPPEDFILKKLYNNEIITEINIGTKPQKIPMLIDLFYYDFFIAGENEETKTSSDVIFNQSKSTTFDKFEKLGVFGGRGFNLGYKANDLLILNDNNKYNISFILAMDPFNGVSGMIGLKLSSEEDLEIKEYNFIKQLKKVNAINNYYFTIKYIDDINGNLIIGDLPENYDNNYKGMIFKDIYVNNPDSATSWNIQIDSVYTKSTNINNKVDLGKINIYFRINLGITFGNEEYQEEFKKSFMTEQINKGVCFEKKMVYYYVYYCDNNVDFSKMKNLYFYNKDLNYTFEFTYKDLFYYNELDKRYYFLIIFEINTGNNRWLIGEFFFKKYQLIFNQEKKKIGLYVGKSDNNNDQEETWISKNKWYIILIVFLVILIIIISIISYLYIKSRQKRKIKANELIDDNYDYTINE